MQLSHSASVDLYCEEVVAEARLVVVRVLGGKSCWSYGVEQIVETCAGTGATLDAAAGRRPARLGACDASHPGGQLRHELTAPRGHRYPDRPWRCRWGSDPRTQGRVAGPALGRTLRAPPGPRRPLAVRGPGLRLHLAPRLYPCPRGARPGGPGRRLGGGSIPSRDPSVLAGLAAPRIPRARHPPAPRLLHGLRNADLPALLGSSGGLVDDLHHRPGVQRARHPRCARRAGPLARARARAPAQSRGPRARRRLARPHLGHQGARRPRGRRFPAGRGDLATSPHRRRSTRCSGEWSR